MNTGILVGGIILLIVWGVWGIFAKLAVEAIGLQIVIWSQIASLILFPLYFVLFSDLLPIKFELNGIALALIAGAFAASGGVILYVMLSAAPASVVIPISALYPLVTVILAFLFLHEDLSWTRIAGVACALVAIWLLSA